MINTKIKINHTEQALWFWLGLRLDLLSFSIYSIIILLIAGSIYKDEYEFITLLSLALTTALNITSPITNFLPWVGVTEEKFRAVERIRKTLNSLQDEGQDYNLNNFELKENELIDKDAVLEFKNVFLKYENKENNILKNISFKIYKGQRIGIIGRYFFQF